MSSKVCRFKSIESKFNFGQYNGWAMSEVLETNPLYIVWCVKYCTGVEFRIENSAIEEIKIAYPEFPINSWFINLCRKRY